MQCPCDAEEDGCHIAVRTAHITQRYRFCECARGLGRVSVTFVHGRPTGESGGGRF